ncbi:MAG TPA: glycosyltransferase family 9 protein [Gemmatirosa sp.]
MSRAVRDRLLLIHPGALGDLVQARDAFARIRTANPQADLAILTATSAADLARSFGLFDTVMLFDDRAAYHGGPVLRARALAAALLAARRFAPTRAGVFKAATVYAALARATGARVRVGLTRGAGARFLTEPIPLLPGEHWADRYDAIAAARGGNAARDASAWRLEPLPEPLDRAVAAMRSTADVLVALAPGGARSVKGELGQKRWPRANYAELARRLLAEYGDVGFLLLGAPSDRADTDAVRAAVPNACVLDLTGQTSLVEARAVIAHADLFVGNDSSLLHLAATTRTPIVTIFGPTDPRAMAPRGAHVRWLWAPRGGVPCHDEITGVLGPCDGTCCIERVTPDEVLHAARELLAAARPTAVRTA